MSIPVWLVTVATVVAVSGLALAVLGIGVVALEIQEGRHGTGCRAAGCRRSRRHGCTKAPRTAESVCGDITQER